MNRITLTSRVGPDGVLTVTVPFRPEDANRGVQITVEPMNPPMDHAAWLKFIEQTAGKITDPTFERPPQEVDEQRKPIAGLDREAWLKFIMGTAGRWQGELERPEQGEYEQRDGFQ